MNHAPLHLKVHCFASPIGWILAAADAEAICLLDFAGQERPSDEAVAASVLKSCPGASFEPGSDEPLLKDLEKAILAYLSEGKPLPTLPHRAPRGTDFQKRVWQALAEIPAGETRTYAQIAERVGSPGAARAVGQACGRNPLALLIPCHRVLATGGKLGGFSGGLPIKKTLLDRERTAWSPSKP